MTQPNDPTGTPPAPPDGSAIPASGTGDANGAGGSGVDYAAEVERLRAEVEKKDNVIAQHLSEKTHTEAARRRADEERSGMADEARARAQIARDQAVLQNPGAFSQEEINGAQSRMLGGMAQVLQAQRDEIRRLKEVQRPMAVPAEAKLPPEVQSRARELVETGYAATMEDAIDKAIGEAVRQGKWSPAAPAADPPPATPRPQPAVGAPRPVATVTRSVPSSQPQGGVPASMTRAEYLALDGEALARAFAARRAGKLQVT